MSAGTPLTFEAVCERLGISKRTLRRYINAGHIQAYTLPTGALRFMPADVAGLLKPKKVSAA